MKTIRVLIADDHSLVRAGLRLLIDGIKGVRAIGEAGDGDEALRLIHKLKPDVVLLDIKMPSLSGLEVLKRSVEEFPEVRIIILTVHQTEEYAAYAFRCGALGYVPKTAASNELELAIKTVAAGGTYISPQLPHRNPLDHLGRSDLHNGIAALTPRQREVLRLIAEGQSTKDIALTLNISAKTVESHRSQLMDRLNIHDVAGLVRYAIRTGVVSIDD